MKTIILIIILFFTFGKGYACDVCGCQLGGPKIDLSSHRQSHTIGLRYSFATFDAALTYNSAYLENEQSHDTYQRIDILGNYHLNSRFQINATLPYLINQMDGTHQTITSKGMGDPIVLILSNIINTDPVSQFITHTLLVGGGLKLPLGDDQKKDNNKLINRNFQLGSGSLDFLFVLNYTFKFGDHGINVNTTYKWNTQNDQNYKFGNQTNTRLHFFKRHTVKNMAFVHSAGGVFEHAHFHFDNRIKQINTGGNAFLGTLSTRLDLNAITLQAEYLYPFIRNFNSDAIAHIDSGNRLTIDVLYHF